MKRFYISLAIAIMLGIALGQISEAIPGIRQETGKGSSAQKKQTFIVIYKPGPAWLVGKPISEQPLKEHFNYMLGLYKSGVMRFAGPFEDNAGGAAVVETSGENEAKALADRDPAVTSRVFIYEMHPWRFVSWEQYVKP